MRALYIPLLFLIAVLFLPDNGQAQCSDLFFSEYIEGSGNNKVLEIYNPTDAGIDLSTYQVTLYSNGNTTPGNTLNWPAGTMLGAGEVYVIANGNADSVLLAQSDTTSTVTFYNGNDALVLTDTAGGIDLDIIGIVGDNPGSNWPVGTGATSEFTLVRKSSVNDGQTDWSISVLGWEVFPQNFADSLGSHSIDNCNATNDPLVSFTVASGSSSESGGMVEISVTLVDIDATYDVDVAVSAGDATQGVDFTVSTEFTISNGETELIIPVNVIDDFDPEDNETFTLTIADGGNFALGTANYTHTIIDDDTPPTEACTQPFFSEYIEGSSNNKLLEIYNPTESALDMSNYRINRYNNGNDGSEDTSGVFNWAPGMMLEPGAVYVIANPSSDSILLTLADTTNSITFYNGDDALELEEISTLTIVDAIGEKGVDPGTNWPVGDGATSNYTLVRSPDVNGGQINWYLGAMTWLVYPINFADSLGSHYMVPCGAEPGPCDSVTIVIGGSVTNESVEGADDGAVDITVSGGTTPYSYEWDNGAMTEDINGLADGAYTVTVTDSLGCTGTAVFNVSPGPGPCDDVTITVSGTPTDETIQNANDGSIDITVTGGTMPYSYNWSNGATTEDIDNLAPDTYTVTVTDSSGCTGMNTFTVNAGTDPCIGVTIFIGVSSTDESAAGAGDGSIDLTVSGGTAPYSYSWDNGATTEDISGLDPGTYTVTVTDSHGCSATAIVPIAAGPTAVNNIITLQDLYVYPNPASGRFHVALQFTANEEISLMVTDIAGRNIYENYVGVVRSGFYTIENNWPAGLYFLKIKAGNNFAVVPIMIY